MNTDKKEDYSDLSMDEIVFRMKTLSDELTRRKNTRHRFRSNYPKKDECYECGLDIRCDIHYSK